MLGYLAKVSTHVMQPMQPARAPNTESAADMFSLVDESLLLFRVSESAEFMSTEGGRRRGTAAALYQGID